MHHQSIRYIAAMCNHTIDYILQRITISRNQRKLGNPRSRTCYTAVVIITKLEIIHGNSVFIHKNYHRNFCALILPHPIIRGNHNFF